MLLVTNEIDSFESKCDNKKTAIWHYATITLPCRHIKHTRLGLICMYTNCELFFEYFQKQTSGVSGWFLWWKEIKFSVRQTNFICSGQWLLRQIWLKWSLLNSADGTFLMISCGYFSWSLKILSPFWVFVACVSFQLSRDYFSFSQNIRTV